MTVRAVRLPLALLVEVLWSYALVSIAVAMLGRDQGSAPSIIGVAAVVAGSFAIARLLQETDLDGSQLRIAGVAASVVALFAIIHTEYAAGSPPWDVGWLRTLVVHSGEGGAYVVTATVVLSALWMRGIARGQQTVEADGVLRSSALGLAPIAIAAAAEPAVHGPDLFGVIAIAYVALALGVLALYQAPDPDRPLAGYAAKWGAGAAALLVGAALLAVVAAAIDPGALGVLAPIGKPVAVVVGTAAQWIVGPPLAAIGWLFSLIPLPDREATQQQMMQQPPENKPEEQRDVPMWTRVIGWILVGGLLTLILCGALLTLWLLFRRFAKRKENAEERRERVEADSSLADDLGAAFDALARRFRRRPKHEQSALEVRRLYHEMLDRSAASGLERPPAATPLQFAPQLDAHYASGVPSAISRAFVDSRYGGREVEAQIVEALRRDWRQIEAQRP